MRGRRAACAVAAALAALLAGCATVNMDRFATTTRIDVMLNPTTAEYPEPFAAELDRLRPTRRAICTDPRTLERVQGMLKRWEWGWMESWGGSAGLAPVLLIFHNDDQWLGTLQLYHNALGRQRSLIRRISPDEATELLRLVIGG
jgi:hypothetical protein